MKLYSRANCAPCITLKYFLDKWGIKYTEVSVDRLPKYLHRIAPTIFLNGEWIQGLNVPRLRELLKV